jgi:fructose/tagatose bisphosphate aldolase
MLVSLRRLLDHAAERGYGLPAFDINNMEQIRAIMAHCKLYVTLAVCANLQSLSPSLQGVGQV